MKWRRGSVKAVAWSKRKKLVQALLDRISKGLTLQEAVAELEKLRGPQSMYSFQVSIARGEKA